MNIVIVDPLVLFPQHTDILKTFGTLTLHNTFPKDSQETIDRVKDADILINFWTPMPTEVCQSLTKTKMLCIAAAGYDWIDVESLISKGIVVTHCPGHNAESVAEHTIGLMLAAIRLTFKAATETRSGKFLPEGYKGKELKGKTVGIIGYGTIGKRVGQIATNGFGMKILHTNSTSTQKEFEHLLENSDIISVNAPLTEKTKNLLSKKEFNLMKNGVVFVNTGRGAIVDESALIDALRSGKIFSAGLDILAKEPYEENHPLLSMSNVIVTPHTAWNTSETDFNLSKQVTDIVEAFMAGNPIHTL